jgi:hypothetical protein
MALIFSMSVFLSAILTKVKEILRIEAPCRKRQGIFDLKEGGLFMMRSLLRFGANGGRPGFSQKKAAVLIWVKAAGGTPR